jgi:hypothetical protein
VVKLTLVIAAGVALAYGGCGGGSPRDIKRDVAQALRDQVRGLREHDVKLFCTKTFLSSDLPPALARKLGVALSVDGSPAAWSRHNRECLAQFGRHGEFGTAAVGDFAIERITTNGPSDSAAGITATATAQVGRSPRDTARLVRFEGDWKVVFEDR